MKANMSMAYTGQRGCTFCGETNGHDVNCPQLDVAKYHDARLTQIVEIVDSISNGTSINVALNRIRAIAEEEQ